MVKVEVCINCDSRQDVKDSVSAAFAGGASTIELCSAMQFDGLTPRLQDITVARSAFKNRPGLMVMVRPRKGDFCYSKQEIQEMQQQIRMAAQSGADGVVFGILNKNDNSFAMDALTELVQLSKEQGLRSTFHRAFDAAPGPVKSVELLIDAGVDRILTSGTPWGQNGTAMDGIETLKKIIGTAQDRIEIVIGGGVTAANAGVILKSRPKKSNMISIHAYSAAQKNGIVTLKAVKALVDAANQQEEH